MSISTVLNKWLKRLYKLLAISLVFFAVFISVLRLFLPYAYHYRENVESYINSTYNINISIGSLTMGWEKSGPTLVVQQLKLLSNDDINISIDNVDVEVNFWRSLQARKFITEVFTISGAEIEFEQALLEKAEKKSTSQTDDINVIDNISSILLEQISRFSIRNSHVLYRAFDGDRSFTINEMFWVNADDRHHADGTVILEGLSSNNVKVLLDFQGKKFDNFTGQAYLEAHEINITPWLGQVLAIDDENTHSAINFDTWINVNAGKTELIQIALGNNKISWQHHNSEQSFEINGGDIEIKRTEQLAYRVSTSPITIKRNDTETNQISLLANVGNKHVNGYIDGIELSSFNGVFPLLFNDKSLENLLFDLAPTGRIENIHFSGDESDIAITASFNDIDSHFSHGIPGLMNASGELIYQNNKLHIALNANNGALDFDKHFTLPIQYTDLSTDIDIEFLESNWKLSATNIAVNSPEISLTGNVSVLHEQDKPLTMSLLASVSDGNAKYAEHYYPLIMGENLYNYLDGAIIDGAIPQATVLFNGPLKSFPFNNNEGIFVVDAELTDSTFIFDPEWPAIDNLSANLNFTNNSMFITARSGSLSGIDVNGVKADINDLANERILNVTANFTQAQPKAVTKLMNESPMKGSIGSVLEQVVVKGAINGNFSLILPLNSPENVIAKGHVDFIDNKVLLQAPEMDFSQVHGRLYYHNDAITASDVKLNWRGMPVTLNALAKQKSDHYRVDIATLGQWKTAQWQAQLPDELVKYASGQLDWQGQLVLNIRDDKLTYDYQANSTLNDITLAIPAPFSKTPAEQVTTSVHAFGDKKRSTITGNVGDEINFHGVLEHQQRHFSLAHLVLGKKQIWQPSNGFHITADLENADYAQWQPLVLDIIASVNDDSPKAETINAQASTITKETASPLLSVPNRINTYVKDLMVYGQHFHDVSAKLTPESNGWMLNLDSNEAQGTAKFYPDWHQQGIDVNLNFLQLTAVKETEVQGGTTLDTVEEKERVAETDKEQVSDIKAIDNPKQVLLTSTDDVDKKVEKDNINAIEKAKIFVNIPPMKVQCGRCQYGLYDFGKVSFTVERESENVLSLNKFVAKREGVDIDFDGKWQQEGFKSQTSISGLFHTDNVAREVESIGYVSTIKDSAMAMNYDISWYGGPHDFSTEALDGILAIKFDDGYLADVDDNGVRLFSLLSLQSLVRKLTFDFRDVFSDGMFYQSLAGSFNLKDGIAYTDDVFMKGSAGDLTVVGNTNLNTRELDYRMTYKPNLTSSLPVLAWIATLNPVTFLAGVALDEVITSSVIAEINFEVTGNLDKPLFKEVSKKTQNISVGRTSPPILLEDIPDEHDQSDKN